VVLFAFEVDKGGFDQDFDILEDQLLEPV